MHTNPLTAHGHRVKSCRTGRRAENERLEWGWRDTETERGRERAQRDEGERTALSLHLETVQFQCLLQRMSFIANFIAIKTYFINQLL